MVLKIGLTGGIGSGKSTACKIFSELGIPIIDADIIAHETVQTGRPALQSIINEFGEDIVTANGNLDRKKLRDKIFKNETTRRKLEDILHPLVYREIINETKNIYSKYCIISIPLLLETNSKKIIDRILIIDLPEELQISRASIRDNTNRHDIEAIIRSQISRKNRLTAADDIINNEGNVNNLRKQICDLHTLYSNI